MTYNPSGFAAPPAIALTTPYPILPLATPEMYGAKGDGSTDDTTALQAFVAALGVVFSKGIFASGATYIVSGPLNFGSNFQIEGNGATIKVKSGTPVDSSHYVTKWTGSNFHVSNLDADANRAGRTPAEVNSHCFYVLGASYGIFENCHGLNSTTDGWYIAGSDGTNVATFPHDLLLLECGADNSYRNCGSLINGYRIDVIGGPWTNANGTSPQAGFDVEPNPGDHTPGVASVCLRGMKFAGNIGRHLSTSDVSSPTAIFVDDIDLDFTNSGGSCIGIVCGNGVTLGKIVGRNLVGTTPDGFSVLVIRDNAEINLETLVLQNCSAGVDGSLFGGGGTIFGRIGSLVAIDCAVNNIAIFNEAVGLTVESAYFDNCGRTDLAGILLHIGADCDLLSSYFTGCKGVHVETGSGGGSRVFNLTADGPNVGTPGSQAVLNLGGGGESIDHITIKNPVSPGANSHGIFEGAAGPMAFVGSDIHVSGFDTGKNVQLSYPPTMTVSGDTVLNSGTTTLIVTANSVTITLAPSTDYSEEIDNGLLILNPGAGTVTVQAAMGDTLVGVTSIATSEQRFYKVVPQTAHWYG